jgi:hypothetical protein
MEKCEQLYKRLQQDISNLGVVLPDQDFSTEESMAMFCLNIMMRKNSIKERDDGIFTEQFDEIGTHYDSFDEKTRKTIWVYFDLFVKLCEKYTKEQTSKMTTDIGNMDIGSKMSQVSELLENKLGMKMNAGMEDMVGIIAKEVQNEIKRGNTNMQGIIKNVMNKVMEQFQSKIDSGEINVDELKASAEKLMSQIGNPAALMGLGDGGSGPQLSREEKRRGRRERLRKKLEAKNKKN